MYRPLVIIGLGNPTELYRWTRHNVGMQLVEMIAQRESVYFYPGKGNYYYARVEKYILIRPTVYMNQSGIIVPQLLEDFNAKLKDIVVVVDDIHLPLGVLRLRKMGSAGGHRGLEDIIYRVGTTQFARLRIGIGTPPPGHSVKDYVLSPFSEEELETIKGAFERAYRGLGILIEEGFGPAMTYINRRIDNEPEL